MLFILTTKLISLNNHYISSAHSVANIKQIIYVQCPVVAPLAGSGTKGCPNNDVQGPLMAPLAASGMGGCSNNDVSGPLVDCCFIIRLILMVIF